MYPRTSTHFMLPIMLVCWMFTTSVSAATFTATICYEGVEVLSPVYLAKLGPQTGGDCISMSSTDTLTGEGGWSYEYNGQVVNAWEAQDYIWWDVSGTPGSTYEFNVLWSYELMVSDIQPGENFYPELLIGFELYSAVGSYSGSNLFTGVIGPDGVAGAGVFEYYIWVQSSYSPVSEVPLPAPAWLLGTGLFALASSLKRKRGSRGENDRSAREAG